jgi:outer membrane receptor for ferrienterochelin and colicins
MKIKLILVLLCLFYGMATNAQLKGLVQGFDATGTKKPISLAKVKLLQSKSGVLTKEDGTFELVLPKSLPDTLIISAVGYISDSIPVNKNDRFIALDITLFSEKILPEVIIEFRKKSHGISKMKTLHVEELTSAELRKAACCNLSESFETNASVDVNITDAVSGAKKIRMMGLDGVYTQIQMENIPYLRGLESSFGLHSLPGTWIESIQITKGTGTVVNGFESMAGLVNLELKKPSEMERVFVNGYQNIFGRSELNLNAGQVLNENWSTGTFAHASSVYGNIDHNMDNFRDLPMGDNLALVNRWAYQGKKMESQFGFNLYQDRKVGGQTSFKRENATIWPSNSYGLLINSRHADVFAKTGFFGKRPYQSLGIVYNLKYQELDGLFGIRNFAGLEKRGYVNAIYDDYIGTTDHRFKVGASFVALDISQNVDTLKEGRKELIPGAFFEYTYTGSRLTAVAGARYDQHNLFGGQFSPRAHLKFALNELTDLRITGGKGWRVPNYMIDNISLLASSKTWIAPSDIKPEISWNIGGSLFHEMRLFENKAGISVDFYHTFFENQLIVDRDTNFKSIIFKNLANASFSNAFQTEFNFSPIKNFEIRLAYKFLSVKAVYDGRMQQQVMIPKHRGFVNLAYRTRNKRWEFDLTCSVYGQSRLPSDSLFDQNQQEQFSSIYPMLNGQITYIYKKLEIYLGGENLTNFKQQHPIIDSQNPFGQYFDATNVWGPIMGINIYGGFRFSIPRTKKKN